MSTSTSAKSQSPTANPTFTPLPVVGAMVTPNEKAYLNKVNAILDEMRVATDQITAITSEASKDAALVTDAAWKARVAAATAALKVSGGRLGEVRPVPPRMIKLDGVLRKISDETAFFYDNFLSGIDKKDARLLGLAQKNMENIVGFTEEANGEMRGLGTGTTATPAEEKKPSVMALALATSVPPTSAPRPTLAVTFTARPAVAATAIPTKPPATFTPKPAPTAMALPTAISAPAAPVFSQEGPSRRRVDPAWWPCTQGQVKGNRNSGIYHAPGMRDYAYTFSNVACFNTETDAQGAGFRRAQG